MRTQARLAPKESEAANELRRLTSKLDVEAQVFMRPRMCTRTYAHAHARAYALAHVQVHVHVYMYMRMHLHMYRMHMHIYLHM